MLKDLDYPINNADHFAAFFIADYRNTDQQIYEDWISPGTKWNNANITDSSFWNDTLTICHRYRIILHHRSTIRRKHPTLNVWIYFTTQIPRSKQTEVDRCNNSDEFKYLGATFSEARAAVVALVSLNFWKQFWPSDVMDEVIFGWEGAAQ